MRVLSAEHFSTSSESLTSDSDGATSLDALPIDQRLSRLQVTSDTSAALQAQAAAARATAVSIAQGLDAAGSQISGLEARAAVLVNEAHAAAGDGAALRASDAQTETQHLRSRAATAAEELARQQTRVFKLQFDAAGAESAAMEVASAAEAARRSESAVRAASVVLSGVEVRQQDADLRVRASRAARDRALFKLSALQHLHDRVEDLGARAAAARTAGDEDAARSLEAESEQARINLVRRRLRSTAYCEPEHSGNVQVATSSVALVQQVRAEADSAALQHAAATAAAAEVHRDASAAYTSSATALEADARCVQASLAGFKSARVLAEEQAQLAQVSAMLQHSVMAVLLRH